MKMRSMLCGTLLGLFLISAGGCLVMKGSSVEEEGVKLSEPTLSQVKLGETTEAWLVAAAGEPSSRRVIDDHTAILRYDHSITTAKGGAVFLIFAGGDEKTETTSTLFEVNDGVITRYWTES